jgi:Lon protease-like protein
MAGVWIRRPPVQEPLGDNSEKAKYECPVCFESFTELEVPSFTTSCGHKTCHNCIEKCLETSMSCPICRHLLLNEKARLCFPADEILGLFILNPSFFAVPGATVLLRVFEPRYLILIKRCISNGTVFGIQSGHNAKRGVLVSIRRYRELPEGHIIMEGLVVSRYVAADASTTPVEEPETYGLYVMKSRVLSDVENMDQKDQLKTVCKQAEDILNRKMDELSRHDKEVIQKICGRIPSPSSYEFSFWILGALKSDEPKANILFCPNALDRMNFCLKMLVKDEPFECLMDEQ